MVTQRGSVKVNRRGLMKQNTNRVFVNIGTIGIAIASRGWLRGLLAFRLYGSLSVLSSICLPKMNINQGILNPQKEMQFGPGISISLVSLVGQADACQGLGRHS